MTETHRSWFAFLIILLVFVLVRVWVLFYPVGSGWSPALDEMPTGNVGVDIDRGLVLPGPAYQFKVIASGTLLEGLLSVPFRRIWGPNLLALKAVAILIHLWACLFWMLALKRLIGEAAAYVFGIFYALPPPAWLHLTHTAWATHPEQSLFLGLMFMILVYAWHGREADVGPGWKPFLLLGLIAGFGVYFGYTGLIAVPWLLLLLPFITERAALRKNLPVTLYGMLLGFSPILWTISYYGWHRIYQVDTATGYAESTVLSGARLFSEPSWKLIPGKLWRTIAVDLPASSLYPATWARWFLFLLVLGGLLFWLFQVGPGIRAAWRGRATAADRPKWVGSVLNLAPLCYALIYLLFFMISGFRVLTLHALTAFNYADYRYFAPLYPIAFVFIGQGFQAAWMAWPRKTFRRRLLAVGGVLVFLSLNASYYRSIPQSGLSRTILETRGDFYFYFIDLATADFNGTDDERLELAQRISPQYRRLYYFALGRLGLKEMTDKVRTQKILNGPNAEDYMTGYGWFLGREIALAPRTDWPGKVDAVLQLTDPLSAAWRSSMLRGLGMRLGQFNQKKPPMETLDAFASWKSEQPDDLDDLAFGLGAGGAVDRSWLPPQGPWLPDSFWRGLGRRLRFDAENMLLSWAPYAEYLLIDDRRIRKLILQGFDEAGDFFTERQ